MGMKTAIVIPARYGSTRFPGKPLAPLSLPDGTQKTLIHLSFIAAAQVQGVDQIYVATDDDRIADAARGFGADVVMTSQSCRNGTERCAEALDQIDADLVVNLQGDAPLTPAWFVTALIDAMRADLQAQVATPVLRCDPITYGHFTDDRRAGRVGGTTAVFNAQNQALYFSKEVIPYIDPGRMPDPVPVFHHVGVYGYRPEALRAYMGWAPGPLETLEGLEQLRFLEHGVPVTCVEVDGKGRVFWELNNPEDIPRIETVLAQG